jgi:hypothetical protein
MQTMEQEGLQVLLVEKILFSRSLNKTKTQLKGQVFIVEFKTINKQMNKKNK